MKKNHVATLWQLFSTFFKIGAFTFGGGYAMISIVEDEVVGRRHWITSQDMLDMLIIAESTPGVIAVNTATSVGYRTRGVMGAIIATLGVVLPSFLIIFGLSFAIEALSDNVWYQAAFAGIQVCVLVLILNAFLKMSKQVKFDIFAIICLVVALVVTLFVDISVVLIIIAGGVAGVVYSHYHHDDMLADNIQEVEQQLEDNEDKLATPAEQLEDRLEEFTGEEQ